MKKPKDVASYILAAPKEARGKLKDIRSAIKKAAPSAIESISYGMPYYSYKGRLVYFACAKEHIGLYIPPPIVEEHKSELKNYSTSRATVRFPLGQKLPLLLIKKLIRAAVKNNDQRNGK
ncbi:MAG TPA: DUF1801 domain-containing protein [archaeon]|nr:DUF1801 domain-containing protein [archaeon]